LRLTCIGTFDGRHLSKVLDVRDPKAPKSVGVPSFLKNINENAAVTLAAKNKERKKEKKKEKEVRYGEVPLEGFAAHVGEVATNLTLVLHTETVQLVEPVGNRLAIPAQGQVQRVVWPVVVIRLRLALVPSLRIFIPLCSCDSSLLSFNVGLGVFSAEEQKGNMIRKQKQKRKKRKKKS